MIPATPEQSASIWATYRNDAQAIFVGQVIALHPFSPAERRAAFPVRILGSTYGDRAGMADVAPVETLQGDAGSARLRYSNSRVCDQNDWNPQLGDFVMVVRDREGATRVYTDGDISDPVIRARLQNYTMAPVEPGERE